MEFEGEAACVHLGHIGVLGVSEGSSQMAIYTKLCILPLLGLIPPFLAEVVPTTSDVCGRAVIGEGLCYLCGE